MMHEGTKQEHSDMMLVREWQQHDVLQQMIVFHVDIKEVDWRSPVSGAFVYPVTLSGENTCGRMD